MSSNSRKLPLLPALTIAAGFILIVGAFFWSINNSSDPVVVSPTAPASNGPYPEIARISAADAKAAYDTGAAVFVDTRGDPYFSQGHIPGAFSITQDELPQRISELDSESWIITYCT